MKKITICYSISCLLVVLLLSIFINRPLIENAIVDNSLCYTIGGQNSDTCIDNTNRYFRRFREKQHSINNISSLEDASVITRLI